MKAVLQRVSSAAVNVEGEEIGRIGQGYLVLLGVENSDSGKEAAALAKKTANLRVFEDENGKLNRSVLDIDGEILVVSNFTLCADSRRGNRPSFTNAARPEVSEPLYQSFCKELRALGVSKVATGRFGADMQVSLINDGPVTILLDTDK